MAMARADIELAEPCPARQDATSYAPPPLAKPLVQIVSNPASGGHSPRRLKHLRDAYVRNGFDAIFSESSPVTPFELATGAARVCIAGGDGTARHVLDNSDLRTSGVAVDIYPAGTINLIAREWGVSSDPDGFVEQSTARPARRLFPVGLNDTCFLACASIGPDARAVAGLSVALKRRIGRLAYVAAMMRVLASSASGAAGRRKASRMRGRLHRQGTILRWPMEFRARSTAGRCRFTYSRTAPRAPPGLCCILSRHDGKQGRSPDECATCQRSGSAD
jgi:hypothetical protein